MPLTNQTKMDGQVMANTNKRSKITMTTEKYAKSNKKATLKELGRRKLKDPKKNLQIFVIQPKKFIYKEFKLHTSMQLGKRVLEKRRKKLKTLVLWMKITTFLIWTFDS